jgi:hypothetical protein
MKCAIFDAYLEKIPKFGEKISNFTKSYLVLQLFFGGAFPFEINGVAINSTLLAFGCETKMSASDSI